MSTNHIQVFATLLLFFINFLTSCLSAAAIAMTADQSALLSLKSKITSDPYDVIMQNWTAESSVCSWVGVTCGKRHHRVAYLDISYMGLTGQIPPQLGNLSFLISLDMKGNNFFGMIPRDLSRLRRLRFVNISGNSFAGEVPSWFASLHRLEFLHLDNNSFTSLDSFLMSFSNESKLTNLDVSFNSLRGKIPESIGNLHGLKQLIMNGNQLSGIIPSSLANLTSLIDLRMDDNFIEGSLPEWMGNLLRTLSFLSFQINQLIGSIPSGLFNISTLQILALTDNNLSDTLPDDMCLRLPLLRGLYLTKNELYGEIPSNISSCSKLQVLGLSFNNIAGEIPHALGELVELESLGLGPNHLSGSVPTNVYNITSLRITILTDNRLSGYLPLNFPLNLDALYLGGNNFGGGFPNSIINCSKLTLLELSDNKLIGPIPSSIGEELRFLRRLLLARNGFTFASLMTELNFIDSLANCRYLTNLALGGNPLNSTIPVSIGNLSSSLTELSVYNCRIKGNIPNEIGNLTGLITLDLGGNDLTGEIPRTLHNLQSLQIFSLEDNRIEGLIPNELCQLKGLWIIYLDYNQLTGPIAECLGNVSSLREIYLDYNNLNSSVPSSLWNLKGLLNLSVPFNSLTGSLPPEIGNLKSAIFIDMSMNQLSRDIPTTFAGLIQLQGLNLADNNFHGPIPESIGSMVSLVSLDLSHNKLNGTIPKSLEALKYLEFFNVSFNGLSGEIPANGPFQTFTSLSFMFNDALCGPSRFNVSSCPESQQHRAKKKKKILIPLLISMGIGALLFMVFLACASMRYRRKTTRPIISDAPTTGQPVRFYYYDLLHATESYNENNLLGKGSFGSVYKGVMRDGTALAVKVFHIQLEGSLRSFEVECETLRNLRHRNLVKVLGSCTNQEFKAIVLEYMPNGSLEKCLYSENQSVDVMQRLNIMIDVASALEYLHHGYSTPVVHCDLKPGNVLLDEDMVARISDFGITKYLNEGESMTHTRTLATLGYMAPEYGSEGIVSTRCDVYSHGIMLLETFTGKRPSNEMFSGDLTLRDWVMGSMPDEVIHVIDAKLIRSSEDENNIDEKLLHCIVSILELGLSCSAKPPGQRMNAKDVAAQLKKIRIQLMRAN